MFAHVSYSQILATTHLKNTETWFKEQGNLNCPAQVHMREYFKFPEFKVIANYTTCTNYMDTALLGKPKISRDHSHRTQESLGLPGVETLGVIICI